MRRLLLALVIVGLLAAPAMAQDDLDGREANVLGVDWANTSVGVTFWVTLYKEMETYDGRGDWWQIEDLDGNVVGSKQVEQLESHYTSNATITVPPGTRYLVVRAHDSAYGYGGQAVVIDLEGDFASYDQGSEPTMFEEPSSGSNATGNETEEGGGFLFGGAGDNESVRVSNRTPTVRPPEDVVPPENRTRGGSSTFIGGDDDRLLPLLVLLVLAIGAVAYYLRRRR